MQQHSRSGVSRFFSPLVLLVCAFLFASAGAAFAYWSASGSGSASATATTLAAPGTGSVGTGTAVSLPVTWVASSNLPASGGPPRGYAVLRSTTSGGETQVASGGCAFSSTSVSTATSCTDSGLTPNTKYFYKVETVYDNWISSTNTEFSATTSKQATTTALSNITPTTGALGTNFNATATVTGNSAFGTPAGTVIFSLYSSSTCNNTASYTTSSLTLSGGQVTGTLSPTVTGTYYWRATYTPTDTFNLTSTSSCSSAITVYAANGSGTMTVSPNAVKASSAGNTLTFTYTAATGGTSNGEVDVAVPAGWTTTPQTTSSGAAGYTTTTCTGATLTVASGPIIQVTGLTLSGGSSCTIVYGAGGGAAGATAPATTGPSTFTTSEKSTSTGTPTNLASSPSVSVVSVTVLTQSATSPTSSITTVNGATDLILVYVDGSSGSPTASVSTGSGTPFSSQSTISTQGIVTSGGDKRFMILIQATGNGATDPVTVTHTGTLDFVDVVQLGTNVAVKATNGNSGTSSPAIASLTSPSFAEIAFIGLAGSGTTTVTPPTGMGALGTYQSNSGGNLGMYLNSTAQASASFPLSSSVAWGTIAVEIG